MNTKPNIVIIMTDQQNAGLCKREGCGLDTTPYLDSLAAKGVWFDRAYTTAPICAPARVSMLTGRFPSAHQVYVNYKVQKNARYSEDIIDVVKKQGYSTAVVGKNHSHLGPERVDHWFEISHNGGNTVDRTELEKAFDLWLSELNHGVSKVPTPFPLECQGPCRVVTDAIEWVSEKKAAPFFMWLSFAEPHNPFQAPEPYFSMFAPELLPQVRASKEALEIKGFKWKFTKQLGEFVYPDYDELIPRARSNYMGMLKLIDDQIKRFVEYLECEKLLENTILIFLSDHGDFAGEYGLMRKGPEIPEVLARIPMFFAGPGIKSEVLPNHEFVSIADVFPTLCEALETAIPHGVQGRSLWPVLTGSSYPRKEFESIYAEQGYGGLHFTEEDPPDFNQYLLDGPVKPSYNCLNSYTQSGSMRMLRKENWKLVVDMRGNGQLYDLAADPMELNNLFQEEEYLKIKSELMNCLLAWCIRMQDPLAFPERGKNRMKKDSRNYMSSL